MKISTFQATTSNVVFFNCVIYIKPVLQKQTLHKLEFYVILHIYMYISLATLHQILITISKKIVSFSLVSFTFTIAPHDNYGASI